MQVLSKGSHKARWGQYVLHVWSSEKGWHGRLYYWPQGEVRQVLEEFGKELPLPGSEGLVQIMVGRLTEVYGCKAFVDGQVRSLRNFLAFQTAPEILE